VRQEVKRLDGYRCQVCGYDGRDPQFRPWVVPHHGVAEDGRKLGIGGSKEQDRVDNCTTLCSAVEGLGLPPNRKPYLGIKGEGSCHQLVEDGHIVICHFDPEMRSFKLLGMDRRRIPNELIWCHRRRDVEKGEAITTRLTAYALIDRDVAKDAHELKSVYKAVDPEAKSFPAYLAARGIDPRLSAAAALYAKSLECGLEWGAQVTATDYRRQLKDAGIAEERTWLAFVFCDAEVLARLEAAGDVRRVRATDNQLADLGQPCVRAGKTFGIDIAQDNGFHGK